VSFSWQTCTLAGESEEDEKEEEEEEAEERS
jgi:hypothetical protein